MDPSLVQNTFGSPTWCSELIRRELTPYGLETPFDLALKLELSAGKLGEATVYRPYGIMAAILGRTKNTKHLLKGKGGAAFADIADTIKEWRDEQSRLDGSLSLIIPAEPSSGRPLSKGSFSVRNVTSYE